MSSLTPNTTFAQRYKVQHLLGAGGHAEVYLALQIGLERPVALKILQSHLFDGPADKVEITLKRFEQEALLISKLRDPHTITMYDYGVSPQGQHFMAFEYIEGLSLDQLQEQERSLEPKRVVRILRQLLMSLQEAHALGVIHRDIKPQNIMIYKHMGRADCIKLLDFGIAKLADEHSSDWTAKGSIVGTPRYTAPERIRSQPLGPASDLYSLGLIAYELLVGTRPFEGLGTIDILRAQISDPSFTLPPSLNVPGALRQIINRLTDKDQAQRYQSAQQVLTDLDLWNAPSLSTLTQAPGHLDTDPINEHPDLSKATQQQAPLFAQDLQALLAPQPKEEPYIGAPTLKLDPITAQELAFDDIETQQLKPLSQADIDQMIEEKKQARAKMPAERPQITPSLLNQPAISPEPQQLGDAASEPQPSAPTSAIAQPRQDPREIHTQTVQFTEQTTAPPQSSTKSKIIYALAMLWAISMIVGAAFVAFN